MVVSSAAPSPLPETSATRKAVRSSPIGKQIEVVAAHGMAWSMNARHRKVRVIAESARKQGLLNIPGDVEFLLHSLPLAFAFHEARIVQDACGFHCECVKDLAIEFGKSSGAAGIEVDDAEKMPGRRIECRNPRNLALDTE